MTAHTRIVKIVAMTALAVLGLTACDHVTVAKHPAPLQLRAEVFHVSSDGRDRDDGSAEHPWRTLRRALRGLHAGQTLYVHRGVYGRRGTTLHVRRSGRRRAPRSIVGAPDEPRPIIHGHMLLSGSHLRVRRLRFIGPTGTVRRQVDNPRYGEWNPVVVEGKDVAIENCEVTGSLWHAGIYLYHADGARLVANYIHDNGDRADPSHANLDHGIYWGYAKGGLIANNLIARNVAHGIQLYPNARGVTVTQNTILSQGRAGVMIAGDSSRNLVVNNVIAQGSEAAIRSFALTGDENVARRNLVAGGGESEAIDAEGVTLMDNLTAPPSFIDGQDLRLRRGSPGSDAAVARFSPQRDFKGRRRSRWTPDVGAFELR